MLLLLQNSFYMTSRFSFPILFNVTSDEKRGMIRFDLPTKFCWSPFHFPWWFIISSDIHWKSRIDQSLNCGYMYILRKMRKCHNFDGFLSFCLLSKNLIVYLYNLFFLTSNNHIDASTLFWLLSPHYSRERHSTWNWLHYLIIH